MIVKKKEYGWTEIMDSIYYNFISKNESFLVKNYATSRNVAHWQKKSKDEKNKIIMLASEYLSEYIKN